jgi:glycerol-3-phosphate dehydrogenase (NAD(P)+)
MKSVFLLGSGSWGTALAKVLLSDTDLFLHWYVRRPEVADAIMRTGANPGYLQTIQLDQSRIQTCSSVARIPEQTDAVVIALPAAFARETLSSMPLSAYQGPVISAAKGLIPGEHLTVTEWLQQKDMVSAERLYMIGGPCHSEEVALEKRSYLTMGGMGVEPEVPLSRLFSCGFVSCSASDDLRGIEFAAILKNAMAIACGMALGTGRGDNFLSVLVSAASRETDAFLRRFFPNPGRDINRSAYLGDLLVTCYSPHSRNRALGMLVGRGYSPAEARIEMKSVAEGYFAIHGLYSRFDLHDFPILHAVHSALYEGVSAERAVAYIEERLL